jgi:peptide/nickel transport system substrate-binding protein
VVETVTVIETIEVVKEVEGETVTVIETVEVVKEVEKEVVVEVEKEVVVTATPAPGMGSPKQGGTLVMAYYQEPEMLNPFVRTATVAGIWGDFMERGLLQTLPNGDFVPDLATEVPTVQNGGVSEDGLTITYRLKKSIVWSDGDPFACDDVVFTYETIMHPDFGAQSTSGYADMESVSCLDDHTVVVKYAQYYAPYLTRFGTIIPSHIGLDPAKGNEWEYNRIPDPVLGPFVPEEWVSGDHMTLVRNEKFEYWESEGRPYLDAVILRVVESRDVGKQLLKTGEVDFVWDLTEADIPVMGDWEGVRLDYPPSPSTERLVLNWRDPEVDAPTPTQLQQDPMWHWALGDVKVRQAIQMGIDKQVIIDKLLYGLAPVGTADLNMGWAKVDIPPSEYNPEKAKALLEEAGWIDEDGDGVRECHGCLYAEEGKVLKLKYQTTSGNALREQVQQVVQEMMKEIGVEVFIENVPSSELFASYASGAFRRHGQFDIIEFSTGYPIDPQRFLEDLFATSGIPSEENGGGGYNFYRWVSDDVDALLADAGSNPDLEKRKELYQQLSEMVTEEVPLIYLYDRMRVNGLSADFISFDNNMWTTVSWNCDEWWLDR